MGSYSQFRFIGFARGPCCALDSHRHQINNIAQAVGHRLSGDGGVRQTFSRLSTDCAIPAMQDGRQFVDKAGKPFAEREVIHLVEKTSDGV